MRGGKKVSIGEALPSSSYEQSSMISEERACAAEPENRREKSELLELMIVLELELLSEESERAADR